MSLMSRSKVAEDKMSSGFKEVQPGIYGFRVLEAEVRNGKSGDYISMKLQLYDGKDELCWAWHQLFHTSDKQFCKDCVSRFLAITDTDTVDAAVDLVGKAGLVGVTTEEYESKSGDIRVSAKVNPVMLFRYADKASASEIDGNGTAGDNYKNAEEILAGSTLKKLPASNVVQQTATAVAQNAVPTAQEMPF